MKGLPPIWITPVDALAVVGILITPVNVGEASGAFRASFP